MKAIHAQSQDVAVTNEVEITMKMDGLRVDARQKSDVAAEI